MRGYPLLIAIALSLGTGSAGPVEAVIPPGFNEVVVFATNSVNLKNDSLLLSGDVAVNEASAGPTLAPGFELRVGNRVTTPAGSILKADSIRIKNRAVVSGDVFFNELKNHGLVNGTLTTPLVLPVFNNLPNFRTGVPGLVDVVVPANDTLTLAEGAYRDILVGEGGSILLSGGIYTVRSIAAEKEARLGFAAPTEVRVAERFFTEKEGSIGPELGSGVTPAEIIFYVAGMNGEDGGLGSEPRAAEIGPWSHVAANFYVPNGTLRLRQSLTATGAFLARDVRVDGRAELALDSFFFNRPPVGVNDSATVFTGATVTVLDSGASSLLANDSDPNGDNLLLTAIPVSGPSHGIVVLNANGTFSYAHDGSENTISDSFVYEVCDDGTEPGPLCDTATVSIVVVPVNLRPNAQSDSTRVAPGGTVTVLNGGATSVLSNDSDPDVGDTLSATPQTTPVVLSAGTLNFLNSDGTFSYTSTGSQAGSDSFTYEACDNGSPVLCDTATVFITIIPASINVSVSKVGSGAATSTVVSTPPGIDCGNTCSADFDTSQNIQLQALADDGFVFDGWTGDGDCADGLLAPDGDKSCTANFKDAPAPGGDINVTVNLAGNGGGSVVSSPAGINCGNVCSALIQGVQRVDLSATPAADSTFDGFSGGGDCGDGELIADATCTATFSLIPTLSDPVTLMITLAGNALGTVTSDPLAISCGGQCQVTVERGTDFLLTARPDEAGTVFAGWGGDCTGGAVTLVTVDDPTGLMECTATFSVAQ